MRPYLRLSYAVAVSPPVRRWLLIWLLLNVADVTCTWPALHFGAREVGPLAAFLLSHGASFAVIALVKLAITLLAVPAWLVVTGPLFPAAFVPAALQLLCLFMAGVVLINLIGIALPTLL